MSAIDPATRARSRGERRVLYGWGRTVPSSSLVIRPSCVDEIEELLGSPPRAGVIARGAGLSYGDAAQNDGGEVLDMSWWDGIISIDPAQRLVTAQAGATLAQLLAALARHGLTLPVVPGTRYVTIAGAVASDVHGKSHHRDGSFARHVASLRLCTPAAGCVEVSPESDPDLFYATLGGMGLTGVIVRATLQAEPLPSPWVAVDVDRTDGLEQTLELMAEEERHRYSAAWLDLIASGPRLGRAVVGRADPVMAEDVPSRARARAGNGARYAHKLARGPLIDVPRAFPAPLLRPASVRAFNELYWHAAPRRARGRMEELARYLFPLDSLGEWNRLYGPAGLIQYQLVIPAGQESALLRCFELIRARRLPVYLAVLKWLGSSSDGPLSFPLAGFTLAIDIPASAPGLASALDALDVVVADCGGRVYLSKDARLRPEVLAAMYPRLDGFHALRARVDPGGVLGSDLARRVGLCGARS
jgi:decaprenylphospho-beta-D-ribofuranose 2-oxidase